MCNLKDFFTKCWKSIKNFFNKTTVFTDSDEQPTNEVWYTTTNEEVVDLSPTTSLDSFGAKIKSNTYSNGKGVIKFDGDVTQIGITHKDAPFCGNRELKTISLPKTVKSLGYAAFSNCRSLEKIDIPKYSIKKIDDFAFAETKIEEISLPESLEIMSGNWMFQNCSKLKSIVIPDSVTVLNGYHMFNGCTSLTDAVIGNSVEEVGFDICFGWCTALTSVTIGNSVKKMHQPFKACFALTSVTIPSSVEVMEMAFCNATSLKEITCNAINPPTIDEREFFGLPANFIVKVPSYSYDSYIKSGNWKNYKTHIVKQQDVE